MGERTSEPRSNPLLTVAEAAALLDRDPVNIRRYCRSGALDAQKIAQPSGPPTWRITRASIETLRTEFERSSEPKPGPSGSERTSEPIDAHTIKQVIADVLADQQKALQPSAEERQAVAEREQRRDEVLAEIAGTLDRQPELERLQRELARSNSERHHQAQEIERLKEELAAEHGRSRLDKLIRG